MPTLRPGPGGVRDDSDVLDEDVVGALAPVVGRTADLELVAADPLGGDGR
jgi:hypothetical protein